jgi:hypothetical protein
MACADAFQPESSDSASVDIGLKIVQLSNGHSFLQDYSFLKKGELRIKSRFSSMAFGFSYSYDAETFQFSVQSQCFCIMA